MSKLSKRERVLLVLLAFIAVGFSFAFFILIPLSEKFVNLTAEKANLETDVMAMKAKLYSYDSGEALESYERTVADYEAIRGSFVDSLTNTELHRLITNECIRVQLEPSSLNMAEIPQKPTLVTPGQIEITDPGAGEIPAPAAPAAPSVPLLYKTTVSVTVNGSYANLQRFIDNIYSIDYIRIRNITYSFRPTGNRPPSASMVLEVIMRNPLYMY